MPAQYIYNANGPTAAASNIDLSARVRAYQTEMTVNAEEGSVAVSTVLVDDEIGSPYVNFTGFRNFRWKETSEGSNSRIIYDGYTADRVISRGPFRVQSSKQWAVNCADLNSILQRRIMRGSDANRPAETDVARIQWAISTSELNLLTDTTYVSTSNPVAMDAVDYRNQRVADILDDCAQQSGKNYFLILNELFDPPRYGLFYDRPTSQTYSSSVRLTNVLADADSTTTYLVFTDDLKLTRDPSRVYSGVIVTYDGGDQYVVDASIDSAFVRRDTISPSWNVKTAAKASARGLRYLQDIGTEEDRIVMSYLVPLARVNRLKEGHRFVVKFSHLPGYEDWTWVRALKRTVKAESEEFYRVTLEATPGITEVGGACATSVGAAEETAHVDFGLTFGPMSIPVSAASFVNAQQVVVGVYNGPQYGLGGCAPIVVGGSGWTQMREYSVNGSHTWLGVGNRYQAAIATPPNMTVSASCSGGGFGEAVAVGAAFPTSSSSPIQSSGINTTGDPSLSSPPTAGNMLFVWAVGETAPMDNATFIADGGTMIVDNAHFSTPNVGGVYISFGIRCVQSGETGTHINVPSNSYSHWCEVTEWAP